MEMKWKEKKMRERLGQLWTDGEEMGLGIMTVGSARQDKRLAAPSLQPRIINLSITLSSLGQCEQQVH